MSRELSDEASIKLVNELNRETLQSLNSEWELAVLYALRKIGSIKYELSHGGPRRADVTFTLANSKNPQFIADITSVSDRGSKEEKPSEEFGNLLRTQQKKFEIPGSFSYRIEGTIDGKQYRNRKVKLALPTRGELPAYFKRHVTPYLRQVKRDSNTNTKIIEDGPFHISISYNPTGKYTSGSHLSYTTAYSLTHNPIYTSLKEKAEQLRNTGFEGCMGVFLCDADCAILKPQIRGATNVNINDILQAFFRNNPSVSFVQTFWIGHEPSQFSRLGPIAVKTTLFKNPFSKYKIQDGIEMGLREIAAIFPKPSNTAINAINDLNHKPRNRFSSIYGASEISSGMMTESIKISSRAVLDLLAGRLSFEKFSEIHNFVSIPDGKHMLTPFESSLQRALSIEEILFEQNADVDDDWITFRLNGPDAATSPFRTPSHKKKQINPISIARHLLQYFRSKNRPQNTD